MSAREDPLRSGAIFNIHNLDALRSPVPLHARSKLNTHSSQHHLQQRKAAAAAGVAASPAPVARDAQGFARPRPVSARARPAAATSPATSPGQRGGFRRLGSSGNGSAALVTPRPIHPHGSAAQPPSPLVRGGAGAVRRTTTPAPSPRPRPSPLGPGLFRSTARRFDDLVRASPVPKVVSDRVRPEVRRTPVPQTTPREAEAGAAAAGASPLSVAWSPTKDGPPRVVLSPQRHGAQPTASPPRGSPSRLKTLRRRRSRSQPEAASHVASPTPAVEPEPEPEPAPATDPSPAPTPAGPSGLTPAVARLALGGGRRRQRKPVEQTNGAAQPAGTPEVKAATTPKQPDGGQDATPPGERGQGAATFSTLESPELFGTPGVVAAKQAVARNEAVAQSPVLAAPAGGSDGTAGADDHNDTAQRSDGANAAGADAATGADTADTAVAVAESPGPEYDEPEMGAGGADSSSDALAESDSDDSPPAHTHTAVDQGKEGAAEQPSIRPVKPTPQGPQATEPAAKTTTPPDSPRSSQQRARVKVAAQPNPKPQAEPKPKPKSKFKAKGAEMPEPQHVLDKWWLRVQSSGAVFVEGEHATKRNSLGLPEVWHSSVIATVLSPTLVATKSGSVYQLNGKMDMDRSLEEGVDERLVHEFQRYKGQFFRSFFKFNEWVILKVKTERAAADPDTRPRARRKRARSPGKAAVGKAKVATAAADGAKEHGSESTGLRRSRSGRLVKPPLAFWKNQRVRTDLDGRIMGFEEGGMEHTALSPTLYTFQRKHEEDEMCALLQTPAQDRAPGKRRRTAPPAYDDHDSAEDSDQEGEGEEEEREEEEKAAGSASDSEEQEEERGAGHGKRKHRGSRPPAARKAARTDTARSDDLALSESEDGDGADDADSWAPEEAELSSDGEGAADAGLSEYEQQRMKTVRENQSKLAELGLTDGGGNGMLKRLEMDCKFELPAEGGTRAAKQRASSRLQEKQPLVAAGPTVTTKHAARPTRRLQDNPQPPSAELDEDGWSPLERERLLKATSRGARKSSDSLWVTVARAVGHDRTPEECCQKWQASHRKSRRGRPARAAEGSSSSSDEGDGGDDGGNAPQRLAITARRGTAQHKQQVRDILQAIDKNHQDDVFDSTPYQTRSKARIDYESPGVAYNFKMRNADSPAVGAELGGDASNSPGLLQRPVDRKRADAYVMRLARNGVAPSRASGRSARPQHHHHQSRQEEASPRRKAKAPGGAISRVRAMLEQRRDEEDALRVREESRDDDAGDPEDYYFSDD